MAMKKWRTDLETGLVLTQSSILVKHDAAFKTMLSTSCGMVAWRCGVKMKAVDRFLIRPKNLLLCSLGMSLLVVSS